MTITSRTTETAADVATDHSLAATIPADAGARIRELEAAIGRLTEQLDLVCRLHGAASPAWVNDATAQAIHHLVCSHVPRGALVAGVTGGSEHALLVPGRVIGHFPRDVIGAYDPSPLADGLAAIAHLEYLRSTGVRWLVVPNALSHVFEAVPEFVSHLNRRYSLSIEDEIGALYHLERSAHPTTIRGQLAALVQEIGEGSLSDPTLLDATAGDLGRLIEGVVAFTPPVLDASLPHLDDTADIVLTVPNSPVRYREACRVARHAVVTIAGTNLDAEISASSLKVERHRRGTQALPSASVIIPTYRGAGLVDRCLAALVETTPEALDLEIIVADDGGGDDTEHVVAKWAKIDGRIRLRASRHNRGFLRNCNDAAEEADRDVLVFLNNDTIPLDGWLTALLRTVADRPDVGGVGGMLLFPDGRLQEAGGVLFSDATGANIGKWDRRPSKPMFSTLREVDYCSAALLASPRSLFAQLGGFDTHFCPAYYEDTDYCFRVRRAGYPVLFQPKSRVVHLEGASSGTDLSAGVKRSQVVNRLKFLERWGSELRPRRAAPDHYDDAIWLELTRSVHGVR